MPYNRVLAVVRRGDRFLLVRRGREPNKGKWGFPGGVQELGETVVEGGKRFLHQGAMADVGEEAGFRLHTRFRANLTEYFGFQFLQARSRKG